MTNLLILVLLASVMWVGLFVSPVFATGTSAQKIDTSPTPTCPFNGGHCFAPGTTVTFEYDITLCSATCTGSNNIDWWLFDLVTVLPPGETYVSTTSTNPAATSTSAPTACPGGGTITVDTVVVLCPSGDTYVKWSYSPATFITSTGTHQAQVIYQASVSLPGGGQLTDTTTAVYNTESTPTPTPTAATAQHSETDVVFVQATPSVSTSLSPSTPVVVGTPVTDQASMTGGFLPMTGSIVYTVYSENTCTTKVPAGTGAGQYNPDTVTVTGSDGTQPTSTAFTGLVGNYWWQAVYTSGDSNNNGAKSLCTSEPLVVTPASPSISTSLSASSVTAGTPVTDTASMTGGFLPMTGSITYSVYTDSACSIAVPTGSAAGQYTPDTVTVTGSDGTQPTSTAFTGLVGNYWWQAVYTSGDSNNNGAKSVCSTEPLTVTAPSQATRTWGYWKNHYLIANAVVLSILSSYGPITFSSDGTPSGVCVTINDADDFLGGFETAGGGGVSGTFLHQLLAAILNTAADGSNPQLSKLILAAEAGYCTGDTSLNGALDSFNSAGDSINFLPTTPGIQWQSVNNSQAGNAKKGYPSLPPSDPAFWAATYNPTGTG